MLKVPPSDQTGQPISAAKSLLFGYVVSVYIFRISGVAVLLEAPVLELAASELLEAASLLELAASELLEAASLLELAATELLEAASLLELAATELLELTAVLELDAVSDDELLDELSFGTMISSSHAGINTSSKVRNKAVNKTLLFFIF
ncbi:MAG: hypothetical protein KAS64_08635 [Spirochaetes bacterium]|nr:hypothetical protein [Spirochaetota bacterium]